MELLKEELNGLLDNVTDDILKIKITELLNNLQPIKANEKVKDNHLITLMAQYELVKELKNG